MPAPTCGLVSSPGSVTPAASARCRTSVRPPISSSLIILSIEDRDGARPAGRGLADFHGKARDGEAAGRQRFEIVQFLQMTIADIPPRLVILPDQALVAGRLDALAGEAEGRVPAPRV